MRLPLSLTGFFALLRSNLEDNIENEILSLVVASHIRTRFCRLLAFGKSWKWARRASDIKDRGCSPASIFLSR